MKQRVLSLILAIVLIITAVPMDNIYAGTGTENTAAFTMSGGVVTGYSDTTVSELIIPEAINGTTVTGIGASAFDGTKYPNLTSIAVLGKTVEIGDKAFGYNGNNLVNNFKLWCYKDSTAYTYGSAKNFNCCYLATGITDISTTQDLSACYTGGSTINVSAILSSATGTVSEDIIWSSEDSSQVTIKPYTDLANADGTISKRAQINVINKTTDTCKIYAKTRSGFSKELTLNLKKSADSITVAADIYSYDEGTKVFTKKTPASSYYDNSSLYVDEGDYILLKASCDEANNDDSISGYAVGLGTYVENTDNTTGEDGILLKASKMTPASGVDVTFTTTSGLKSKKISLKILRPATEIVMFIGDTQIGEGGTSLVQGEKSQLKAKLKPTDTTDTVTWSSSNPDIASIGSDGTLQTTGFGTVNITCKIADAKSNNRTLQFVFPIVVAKKINYSSIDFVDGIGNKITSTFAYTGETHDLFVKDLLISESDDQPNERVTYSISDTTIATVDENGKVTPKKQGSVKVTAKADSGVTATMDLYIVTKATAISVDVEDGKQLPVGQTLEIPYSVSPSDSTEPVVWTSDDSSAVEIVSDENGVLVVKALKVTDGNIIIRGYAKATTSIKKEFSIKPITAIHANTISIVPDAFVREETDEEGIKTYCIEKGSNIVLTAITDPVTSNDGLKWTYTSESGVNNIISSKLVGNVNTITGVTPGKVTVKIISSNGLVAVCNLKVIISSTDLSICNSSSSKINSISMERGVNGTIKAIIAPANSTDNIYWSTEDKNIIDISSPSSTNNQSITIIGKKTGTATIKARTDSGKTEQIQVNVYVAAKSIDFTSDGKKITTLYMCANQTKKVSLENILPIDTTDTSFSWSCVNSNIVITPSEDSLSADVLAKATGNYTLSVVGNSSGKSFNLSINVIIGATSLNYGDLDSNILMNKGTTSSIKAYVGPTDNTDTVTWTTDKEGIIKVAVDGSTTKTQAVVKITAVEAGTVQLTATTVSGLTKTVTIEVRAIDISVSEVVGIVNAQIYNGNELKPIVNSLTYSGTALRNGTDYKIDSYISNINAGKGYVVCKGIGNYTGTKKIPFTINKLDISSRGQVFYEADGQTNVNYEYTGNVITPKLIIKYNNVLLVNGTDYDLVYTTPESTNVKNGYKITINYKGNFSGTTSKYYNITAKGTSTFTIKVGSTTYASLLPSKVFKGCQIEQELKVYDGTKLLVEKVDYTVQYANNINVTKENSLATVTIRGVANSNYSYSSTKIMNFAITQAKVTSDKITGTVPSQIYSMLELQPNISSIIWENNGNKVTMSKGNDVNGFDIVKYENNINVGTGYIVCKGRGNLTGEFKVPFTINQYSNCNALTYIYNNNNVYTGVNIRPAMVIKHGAKTLVNGVDYKIIYPAESVKVSSSNKIEITFMGNYSGTITKYYNITAKSIAGVTVKNTSGKVITSLSDRNYSMTPLTQKFYVYDGSKKLVEGTDYRLQYFNNTNASTAALKAYVEIIGLGNYNLPSAKKTLYFTIKQYSVSGAKITSIPNQIYNGNYITPYVTVKRLNSSGKYVSLTNNVDYTLKFTNNKATGKATITVIGKGNYRSYKTISFRIVPKQVAGLKISAAKSTSITLSWTKNSESVSGYAVYKCSSSGKYTYIGRSTTNSYTVKSLKSGSNYTYAVRAFKMVGTLKYYGNYSTKISVGTAPSRVSGVTLTTVSSSVKVGITAVRGATGYEISYSTNGRTYKKAGQTSALSYSINGLSKGQKVYVRVKAYRNILGTIFYGSSSSTRTIVVK